MIGRKFVKIRYPLIIAVLTLSTGVVYAGLSQPAPVVIDLVNGFAQGDQLTARTADNDFEYIGCGIRLTQDGIGGIFEFGFCQAADSGGVQLTCFTQDAGLLDAMKAASDYAFITFSFVETSPDQYDCSRIGFSTQSFYLPDPNIKAKDK
jgi:hypothetical protein